MAGGMDISNIYNTQAQNNAAKQRDWEVYESYKAKAKEPTPAEISQNIPPSEATKQSDADMAQIQSFQFYNSKNIEKERAIHKQVKEQLQKDGYMTKAAMISANYSSRSDKGQAMMGS